MSQYSDFTVALGAELYPRLGEASGTTAVDSSGHGHDGTYANVPTLGVAGAIVGDPDTAVTFTKAATCAISPRVELPFVSAYPDGDFTYRTWVKTAVASQDRILMSEGSISGSVSTFAGLRIDGTGYPQFLAYNAAGMALGPYGPQGALTDGAWHCVHATKIGTAMKLFIDAILRGSSTFSGSLPTNLTKCTLMAVYDASAVPTFCGSATLDEPAFFKRGLTPSEISADYARGLSPPSSHKMLALTGVG